jgi:type II secretory pathway pseudopilin PulG
MAAVGITARSRALERLRRIAAEENGFGIVEVVMAMMIISIAVLALVSVFAASALSLHRAAQRGTAVTLAETQMERYRTVSFTGIRIDGGLIPTSSTDSYVTGHTTNPAIPPSSGQALAGQNGDDACPSVTLPAACYPVQTVTGPDGRTYTIDTYVHYANNDATLSIRAPASGLTFKVVTVDVRDASTGGLLAEDSSAFQST